MAVMRPLKAFALLGFSPLVLASATCRVSPLIPQRGDDQLPQCSLYSSQAQQQQQLRSFSYRLAASYSGKGKRFDPRKDLFSFPQQSELPSFIDKDKKRPNSGQDAFFVGYVGNSTHVAFGVADGVGGWVDSGIDPADFAHGLCEKMKASAASVKSGLEADLKPASLLQIAYDGVVEDDSIYGGGSTAVVAVGRNDGRLEIANLGDSGFVQLRPNKIYYASEPQTHAFNTPYQLSLVPPEILARSRAFGGAPLADQPSDASVTTHRVRHGDVLVFASDGVWDNLSASDVLRSVSERMVGFHGWMSGGEEEGYSNKNNKKDRDRAMTVSDELDALTQSGDGGGGGLAAQEKTLQAALAVALVGEAKAASMDQKRDGPFAREVQRHYPNEKWHGGKVDDICVVVAVVVEE